MRALFLIPTVATVVWALVPESWWLVRWPLALFGAYFVADTLLVNTSIAFVTQRAVNRLRSVVLSMLTFVNLASVFAFFYVLQQGCFSDGKGGGRSLTPMEAEYFSLVTIATLGYGDITPGGSCAWLARLTVIAELGVGLYFLAVILSIVTQWVKEV